MKTSSSAFLALLAGGIALAQGPLTPPPGPDPIIGPVSALNAGLPQATMKTLHQVEPRTPLTAGQLGVTQNENGGFTISVPGSYYLTASFGVPTGSGIRVEADFVTLDLNGMNVYSYGSPASGAGVEVVGFRKGLTVRNGFIVGATTTSGTAAPFTYAPGGFLTGVLSDTAGPAGSASAATIENLDVRGCAGFGLNVLGGKYVNCNVDGCAAGGIGGMHAEGCTVTRCGGNGLLVNMARRCEVRNCNATGMIVGTAEQCIVTDCVDIGIWAWGSSITGCFAYNNGSHGFLGQTVTDSTAGENDGTGIYAVHVRGCIARNSGGVGIECSTATDCEASGSGGIGISGDKVSGSISRNSGTIGIQCSTATDCLAENSIGVGISADKVSGSVAIGGLYIGIVCNAGSDCIAKENEGDGFFVGTLYTSAGGPNRGAGAITNCTAAENGGYGIWAYGSSINGCSATQNGDIGIIAAYGVVVSNCCSAYNTNSGIVAHGGSVSNCAARKNGEHGISAYDASISHCTADSNNTRDLGNRFGIEGYFSTISFCVSAETLGGNDYSPPINTAGATWFNCR